MAILSVWQVAKALVVFRRGSIDMTIERKNHGFTLVEMMVAIVILAIGLLGLAAMTVVVLRSSTLSRQISEASNIASNLLDTLTLQNVTNLPDCTGGLVAANATQLNCRILFEGKIVGNNNNIYLPSLNNQTCGIQQVIDDNISIDANWGTFDAVQANFAVAQTFGANDTLCAQSNIALPAGQYIRYYRTFDPDPNNGDTTQRTVVVVVLWRDRYGVWRSLKYNRDF